MTHPPAGLITASPMPYADFVVCHPRLRCLLVILRLGVDINHVHVHVHVPCSSAQYWILGNVAGNFRRSFSAERKKRERREEREKADKTV